MFSWSDVDILEEEAISYMHQFRTLTNHYKLEELSERLLDYTYKTNQTPSARDDAHSIWSQLHLRDATARLYLASRWSEFEILRTQRLIQYQSNSSSQGRTSFSYQQDVFLREYISFMTDFTREVGEALNVTTEDHGGFYGILMALAKRVSPVGYCVNATRIRVLGHSTDLACPTTLGSTTDHTTRTSSSFQNQNGQPGARRRRLRPIAVEQIDPKDVRAEDECPICHEPLIEDGDEGDAVVVRTLCQGRHVYHDECICRWLMDHDACPFDRERIFSRDHVRGVVGEAWWLLGFGDVL